MPIIMVFTYSYEGCGTLGLYSSQALADAQIRRWVAVKNATYAQINAESDDDYRFKLYIPDENAEVLTYDRDGEGITSRALMIDAAVELTIPPWLKTVPEGSVAEQR